MSTGGSLCNNGPCKARLAIMLMLSSILFGACTSPNDFSYLALGDSYTIGEGVTTEATWPAELSKMLKEDGVDIEFPIVVARTGWTTGELISAIDADPPCAPFDLVTLLIGVNNQYRGQSLDNYRREFRTLLEMAIGFADAEPSRVLILSIPDWSVTPFAADRDRQEISRKIDLFNQANREETVAAGARYLDITGVTRTAASDETMLTSDGLHPSGKMYKEWARLALSRMQE